MTSVPPVSGNNPTSNPTGAANGTSAPAAGTPSQPLIISYSQMEAAHGSIEELSALQTQLSSLLAPYQLADMNVAMILSEGSFINSDGETQDADGWSGLFADNTNTDSLYKDVPGA